MSILTLECTVEHGLIRLPADVHVPENATVYVLVPGARLDVVARVASPRLARRSDADDFVMEVELADAGV